MNITTKTEGTALYIEVEGRLDTTTSPELDAIVKNSLDNVETLEFDFAKLEYISSAGLRVLLSAQKTMSQQGSMTIKNANEEVVEVFEITGFADILTLQ